jgi:hypothetical protein
VALAVDGTVLINQSTITNGLTGCPTGGHFPILICQSGSYRLSGNLTVPDAVTDAIDITADNVTIDLNGFSVLGPTVCSGSSGNQFTSCSPVNRGASGNGIISNNANIVVMNGQVKGMGFNGIALSGTKSRVLNVQATSNFNNGIFVAESSLVSASTVTSNGGSGIFAFGLNVVLTGNIVSLNFGFGILTEFAGALISGNSVGVTQGPGITAVCPSLISGNMVNGNTGGNIVITSGSGCVLANNATAP